MHHRTNRILELCKINCPRDRIRNKMGNENKQEILSSDKNAYVQDWLENIDSPHTSFKRNERQKPSEKTKKINILSNIVINKGNEIKEFNNNSIKEDYCPIKRRKSHLENYEAEYVQGDTRNIQGNDEKIQDDAEKVYGDAGKIQDDAEKVYGDAGKIQGDAEKAQSYTENIQSDGDDIQSEDGDNSVKDPLYVLPSSEDSSTSSLENYIEEGSCEGGSIVIPTIPTINWKYEQNEPLRNENQVGVKSVETVKKKHYSDKRNYCFYCEKDVTHFMRHILTWHPSEITVEKIVSLPLKSKARRIALASLRKRGNYIKNRADDNLRPVKRVDCNETAITDDFLPCSYCLGFYKKKSLYRHTKTCPENTDNSKRRQTAQSDGQTTLLMGKILEQDKLLARELFPRMRADKINAIAKKDMLICKYAYSYIKGRKSKGNLDFVRQNIRRLAKMLDFCRTQDSKVKNLIDILRPINFALIIKAVNYLAHYNSETDVFESPTLAMNFGTLLKKCCDLAYIQLLQIDNTNDQRKDLKILKKLIESQWADEVSAQAALNLNENKWNKSELLPLTSDLKKLNVFLKTSAEISFKKLNTDQDNFNAYTSLKEVVYCQIILLNRRRPGEVAQLKIDKYNDISNTNSGDGNTEFEKCLTETEKILLHSYSRIVIRGKRGRGVPILLSPEMKTHFEYLVSMRNRFVRDNKYVFHSSGQGFLDGTKVLYKYAEKCEVDRPKSISATKLRKHLATITQLLHFNDKDLEQLSRFMGHTLKTHCNVYRLSDNMYQTAKVSKLLLLMTEEGIEQYKGKTLDEIDVDLSPVVEEENLVAILPSDNENLTESLIKNEIADSADEQLPNSKQIKLRKRIVRQNWTEEEKSLIATHFSDHIKNKRAPKQNEVNEFVALYPNFAKRKWTSLKAVVFNMYTNKLMIK